LDQWLGPAVWPLMRETILHIRKLAPDVMLRARGIGNYGDYYTPEGFVPGEKQRSAMPWMVIYPLGRTFSYDPDAGSHKGAKWMVHQLVDSVAKGGNFMVGIGPNPEGAWHPAVVEQLSAVGDWLRVNGEAIYETREREGDLWREGESLRFTRTKDGRTVYIHALEWPGSSLEFSSLAPAPDSPITLLGDGRPLSWQRSSSGAVVVDLPSDLQDSARRPCEHAYVFKCEVAQ
jgi:alpha-L-fucosidase